MMRCCTSCTIICTWAKGPVLLVSFLHPELEISFPSSLARININSPPQCHPLLVAHILLPLHPPFSAFQVVSCISRCFSLRQTSTGLKSKVLIQNSARFHLHRGTQHGNLPWPSNHFFPQPTQAGGSPIYWTFADCFLSFLPCLVAAGIRSASPFYQLFDCWRPSPHSQGVSFSMFFFGASSSTFVSQDYHEAIPPSIEEQSSSDHEFPRASLCSDAVPQASELPKLPQIRSSD